LGDLDLALLRLGDLLFFLGEEFFLGDLDLLERLGDFSALLCLFFFSFSRSESLSFSLLSFFSTSDLEGEAEGERTFGVPASSGLVGDILGVVSIFSGDFSPSDFFSSFSDSTGLGEGDLSLCLSFFSFLLFFFFSFLWDLDE